MTTHKNGCMDDVDLDSEQEFLLQRVLVDAQDLSRDELVEALVNVWSSKFLQHNIYSRVLLEHGIGFMLQEHLPVDLSDPDSMQEYFGHEPSEEEAAEYVLGLIEGATMELDMDEIGLTSED